jgi:uncharacterized membrane protein YqjE
MPEASSSLMESVKRLASTLISIVSTRLELLANELQEERLHLSKMLLFSLSALFFFGVGILLLTVFIVVLFWDDHRQVVLGGLSLLFFVLAGLMAMLVRNMAQTKSKLFSVSIAELAKDNEQLEPRELP